MRAAALAGLAVLAAPLAGCGAIFHATQTVEIATSPADEATVYQSGTELPKNAEGGYETTVFINQSVGGPLVAISGDERLAEVPLEQEASAAAIVCDILWSLTIIGVAAPISDAAMGTFVKTTSPAEVVFGARADGDNPMPVYVVGGARIEATEAAPPPSASSPAPGAEAPGTVPTPSPQPPAPTAPAPSPR